MNTGRGIYPQPTTVYFAKDQIGSSRTITAGFGYPVWQSTFLPFGQEYNPAIGGDSFKFTDLEHDSESGLDHAWFRNYSSLEGRWLTPDPYNGSMSIENPQTLNRYSYVVNSPLSFTDPSGLEVCDDLSCDDWGGGDDWSVPFAETDDPADGASDPCPGCFRVDTWEPYQTGDALAPDMGAFYCFVGLCGSGGPTAGGDGHSVVVPNGKDPACNNQQAVAFSHSHANDAAIVAQQLGVPTQNILGLSGIESQWGTNRFAVTGNNFFSLHGGSSAPFANGSMRALKGAKMSTFPSYLDSARSFAEQYGRFVKGMADPKQFAEGLIRARYNSGRAPDGNPNFVRDTSNVIQMTKRRMGC